MNDESGASDPLQPKLLRWLTLAGLPLEFQARAAFAREGHLHLEHGAFYRDQNTDELREVDLVATSTISAFQPLPPDAERKPGFRHGDRVWITVKFVVECKSSKDKPWVGLLRGRDEDWTRSYDHLDTLEGKWFERETWELRPHLTDAPILAHHGARAYQLRSAPLGDQPPRENHDDAHNAVRQVLSATRGLLRDVVDDHPRGAILFVPVLVTAAPLYSLTVPRLGGEPRFDRVPRLLLAGRLRAGDTVNTVWVVHESDLSAFAAEAATSVNNLF